MAVKAGNTNTTEYIAAAANEILAGLASLSTTRTSTASATSSAPIIKDITLANTLEVATPLTAIKLITFQVKSGGSILFRYRTSDDYYPLADGAEESQDFQGVFTGTLYLKATLAPTIVSIKYLVA